MKRGRALMWVACAGISGASRQGPSAEFAPDKPSMEANDSEVPGTKCRRTRRSRRSNPHQRPAPRAATPKLRRSLQSKPELRALRDDGGVFLTISRGLQSVPGSFVLSGRSEPGVPKSSALRTPSGQSRFARLVWGGREGGPYCVCGPPALKRSNLRGTL